MNQYSTIEKNAEINPQHTDYVMIAVAGYNGAFDNSGVVPGETIKPDEVTIAEALKTANYRTGYFGKWHNGAQYPSIPTGQGFDESFGFNAGHVNNYFDAVLLTLVVFLSSSFYLIWFILFAG